MLLGLQTVALKKRRKAEVGSTAEDIEVLFGSSEDGQDQEWVHQKNS